MYIVHASLFDGAHKFGEIDIVDLNIFSVPLLVDPLGRSDVVIARLFLSISGEDHGNTDEDVDRVHVD